MKHLLDIESLTKDELSSLIDSSSNFIEVSERDIKKVPALRGKTIINLFMEPSTRTRVSFEIAGKRLSADTINITSSGSSTTKGETLLDTARNIEAMRPDILVMRHNESGAAKFLADYLKHTAVVNAGDGMHEHPTQALLDCLTLKQHFKRISGLKIAIVGDIRHSRVARSNIWAHKLLGNEVTLVSPPTLLPFNVEEIFGKQVRISHSLSGISGADVVLCLRMQLERQGQFFVPNLEEYCQQYCITEKVLQRYAKDAVILHPGPINRGVELSTEVADGPRSLISKQVEHGVAVRMAVLFALGVSPELKEAV